MSAVGSDHRVEGSPKLLCCGHYVDDSDFAADTGNTGLELGNTAVRMFVDLLLKHATQKIIQKIQIWAAAGPDISLHEVGGSSRPGRPVWFWMRGKGPSLESAKDCPIQTSASSKEAGRRSGFGDIHPCRLLDRYQ